MNLENYVRQVIEAANNLKISGSVTLELRLNQHTEVDRNGENTVTFSINIGKGWQQ